MADIFVRKGGNDAHAGTSAGTAFLTIQHALGVLADGDRLVIGGGIYRELLQFTNGPYTVETILHGDWDGSLTGDAGEVRITARLVNDTTLPDNTASTVDLNNVSHLSFEHLTIMGSQYSTGSLLGFKSNGDFLSQNQYFRFSDCLFHEDASLSGSGLFYGQFSLDQPLHALFERCIFFTMGIEPILFYFAKSASAEYDVDLLFRACAFYGGSSGSMLNFEPATFDDYAYGGIELDSCTALFASNNNLINQSYSAGFFPMLIHNCQLAELYTYTALLGAQGQATIVEEANVLVASGGNPYDPNPLPAGLHSVSDGSLSLLTHLGQELQAGAHLRPFGMPVAGSPLLGRGGVQVAVGIPGTAIDNATSGTIAWSNPTDALIPNEKPTELDATATAIPATTGLTHFLAITNHGFAIPSDATITGVRADWWDWASANPGVSVASVRLIKGGALGTDQIGLILNNFDLIAGGQLWNGAGGDGEMWGETLTPADVNASNFGVGIQLKNTSAGAIDAFIDFVRLTVFYQLALGSAEPDLLGRPRPAGAVVPSIGALERHDVAVLAASPADGSYKSYQIDGYGDFDLTIPVDAAVTELSIKVQYDNLYGGTLYPQALLTNGGEAGIADELLTATTAAHNAWETLTFTPFTPSAKGVITLRLLARSNASSGKAYFAHPEL